MTNIEEIWKPIPNYDGFYEASNLGRIKTIPHKVKRGNTSIMCKENITHGSLNVHGYMQITLSKNGNNTKFIFHRLIAKTFIPNPENKRTINHINGIKTDNRIENLEWATDSENNLHSFKVLGRIGGNTGNHNNGKICKPIYCFTNGTTYNSIHECSADLSIKVSTIRSAINTYFGKHNGVLKFRYV